MLKNPSVNSSAYCKQKVLEETGKSQGNIVTVEDIRANERLPQKEVYFVPEGDLLRIRRP